MKKNTQDLAAAALSKNFFKSTFFKIKVSGGKTLTYIFRPRRRLSRLLLSLLGSLFATLSGHALALDANTLPGGGTIGAGSGSITSSANTMRVTQASQDLVVNWNSFNIGSSAAVQFVQPAASSVALNRVLSSDPSLIFGSLSANGKVFLVNPSGVLFGSTAKVDVGGLVASTLSISDAAFLAGRTTGQYDFSGHSGTVVNLGAITAAEGGFIALLAPQVRNEGVVTARLGSILMAGGNHITLDTAGDGLIKLAINQGAADVLVDNQGMLKADGGLVYLGAIGFGNLAATVVNNAGVIEAKSLAAQDGKIVLIGGSEGGVVANSGSLDTSGTDSGGMVELSGASFAVKGFGSTIKTGTILLDPASVTIADGAVGAGISGTTVSSADLESALASANVLIQATGSIAVANLSIDNGGGGDGRIDWASNKSLTLQLGPNTGSVANNAQISFAQSANELRSTGGGSIILDAATFGTGHNTSLQNIGKLSTNGAGSVTLSAIGSIDLSNNITTVSGAVNATTSSGAINQTAGSISTGGGNISLTAGAALTTAAASSITGNALALSAGGGSSLNLGGAVIGTGTVDLSSTGGINIASVQGANAGTVNLNNFSSLAITGGISASSGTLTAINLLPAASKTIGIGGAAGSYDVNVSNSNLAALLATSITIGNSSSGNIGIGTLSTGVSNLVISTAAGSSINQDGGTGITIASTGNVSLSAGAGVGDSSPVLYSTPSSGTLAVSTSAGVGNVSLTENSLASDLATSKIAVTTAAGKTVSLASANNGVTVDNSSVIGSASDNLVLSTKLANKAITVATGQALSSSGNIYLLSDNLSLVGTGTVSGANVSIAPVSAAAAIELGVGAADSAGVLGVSNAELALISSSGVLTLGNSLNTGSIAIVGAAAGGSKNISLTTGASITDVAAATLSTTGALVLTAQSGIGTAAAILLAAPSVSFSNAASGDVTIANANAAGSSVFSGSNAAAGMTVDLSTSASALGIGAAGISAGATGTVNLNASGAIVDATGGVVAGQTVNLGLLSASSVGASGKAVNTAANNLDVAASAGAIYIVNSGALANTNLVATGGLVNLQNTGALTTGLGNITSSNSSVTVNASGLLTNTLGQSIGLVGGTSTSVTGLGVSNAGSILADNGSLGVSAGTGSLSNSGSISNSASANSINLSADKMDLSAGSITAGTGDVVLASASAGHAIDLGSATDLASNRLELSSAEIASISTSEWIRIGTGAAGAIDISAAIATAGIRNIDLRTAAGITQSGSGAITGNSNLGIHAAGTVALATNNNQVASLGASVTGASHSFSFKDSGALNIGNEAGAVGITTVDGAISVTSAGALTLSDPVNAGSVGSTVSLTGLGITNNTTLTGPAGISLDAGAALFTNSGVGSNLSNSGSAGPISITADDWVLGVGSTIAGGTGTVSIQRSSAGGTITLGTTDGAGALVTSEFATITAANLAVGGAGFTGVIDTSEAVTFAASTANVKFWAGGAGGSITNTGGAAGLISTGAVNLNFVADAGIGSLGGVNAMQVVPTSGTVSASNANTGDLFINVDGDFTVGGASIAQNGAGNLGLSATANLVIDGNIDLNNAGSITLNAGGGGFSISQGSTGGTLRTGTGLDGLTGSVVLGSTATDSVGTALKPILTKTANLSANSVAGDVYVSNTGTGALTINLDSAAVGGDMSIATSGDLTVSAILASSTGNTSVSAGGLLTNSAGTGVITAPLGVITLSANDMSLLGVIGTALTANAVNITSTNPSFGIDLGGAGGGGASGPLGLTSAEINSIISTGVLTIGSTASASHSGVLSVTGAGLTGLTTLTGLSLVNAGNIAIGADITVGANPLILQAGGTGINQTAGAITAASLSAKTLNNTGAAISLTQAGNTLANVDFSARNLADSANAAGAIAYSGAGFDIAAAGIHSTSTVTLVSAGTISQTGLIAGSTLSTTSVGGRVLNAANTLTGFSAANSTSGDIELSNTGALSISAAHVSNSTIGGAITIENTGAISLIGNLDANSGSITLDSLGLGSISGAGILTGDTLNLQTTAGSSGAIGSTLQSVNSAGTSTINLGQGSALLGAFINHSGALTLNTPSLASNAPLHVVASLGLTLPAVAINTGSAELYLESGSSLSSAANLSTSSGALSLKAVTGVALSHALSSGSGAISISSSGVGTLALNAGGTLTSSSGDITLNAADSVSLSEAINSGSGKVAINANTDGAGANGVTQNVGGSITSSNSSATAVVIKVNATTGTGGISLADDITANTTGGRISLDTANGGTTGGSITRSGGSLTADSIVLSTPTAGASGIGATGAANNIATTASSVTASAGSGGVFITEANGADFTASSSGGAIELLSTTGNLNLVGASSAGAGNVLLTASAGSISSSGTLSTSGSLTGSASGSAVLGGANTIATLGGFSTNGALTVNDTTGGLTVTGTLNSGTGAISVSTAGGALALGANNLSGAGVTLNGVGVSSTAGTVDGGAGDILVNGGGGAVSLAGALTTTSNSVSAVTLRSASTVALGDITTGATGTTTLGVAGDITGAITQTGIITTGTLIGSTGALSSVTLGGANLIANLGAFSAGAGLTLNDSTLGLTVTGTVDGGTAPTSISTAGGALALGANNLSGAGVTLNGVGVSSTAGTVNGGAGDILVNAGGGAISLAGALTTTGNSVSAVTVRNASSVALGNLTTGATGTTTLGVASDITGAITQTGIINTGTLIGSTGALSSVMLGGANLITNVGAFSAGAGLTLNDSTLGLTVTGSVNGGTAPTSISTAGGALALGANNLSGAGVTLNGVGVTSTAGTVDGGAGDILVNAGGGAVSLAGALTTTGNSVSAVTVRNASTVALGNVTTGATGTTTLGVAGDITGAITQTGIINTGTLTGSTGALSSVTLGGANLMTNLGAFSAGAGLTLNDSTLGLTVTGTVDGGTAPTSISTAGGALALGANNLSGAGVTLNGVGVSSTAGTVDGGAGDILVNGGGGAISLAGALTTTGNSVSAVTVRNASTVALGNVTTGATGTTTLGVAGDITGAITQTGIINTGTLIGSTGALSSVMLGGANLMTNLGAFSAGAGLTLNDSTLGLTVTGTVDGGTAPTSISTAGGALALGANNLSGAGVTLNGVGVTSTAGTVDGGAGDILVNAGGGAISLAGALTTTGNSVSAVTVRNASSVALGNLTTGATGTTTLGVASDITGAITQTGIINTGTLTGSTGALSSVTLGGANLMTNLGVFSAGAGLTLNDSTLGLTVTGTVDGGTAPTSISTAGGVLALGANNLSGAGVTLNGVGVTSTAGTVNGGAGDILVNAGGGAISLAGALTTTGNSVSAVTVRNASSVALGNITSGATGTTTLGVASDITGAITQTGIINTGTLIGSTGALSSVTLGGANLITNLGAFSAGAGLTLNDSTLGLTVTGTVDGGTAPTSISTAGGALALGANNLSGAGVTLNGVGVSSTAGTVDGGAGDILLNAGGGAISLVGALTTTGNSVSAVTLRNASTVALGNITTGVTGTTTLGVANDISGAMTQTGSISSGNLAISAAGPVTLNAANSVTNLAANLTGAGNAFSYTDADALNVTTVNAINGITTNDGAISVTASSAGLTLNQNVTASLAAVSLTAGGANALLTNSAAVSGNALSLSADQMSLAGGTLAAGVGRVTLKAVTAGRLIDLGAADSGTTLGLSAADLSSVSSAGVLQIGDASAGALNISQAISPAGAGSLHLQSGSTLSESGSGTLSVASLALSAIGAITLTNANAISNLAASGGAGLALSNATGLTVGTVDGLAGVSAGSVTLTASTGNIVVSNTAATNDINASGAVSLVTLANDALVQIASGAKLNTSSGGVTLQADRIDLSGTLSAAAQAVLLRSTDAAQSIEVGGASNPDSSSKLTLTQAEADNISAAASITIGHAGQTAGISVVGNLSPAALSGAGTLALISGGAISDSIAGAGAAGTLSAANITLTAANGIGVSQAGSYNPLSVQTPSSAGLTASNSSSGDIALLQASGALTVGGAGAAISNAASNGAIDLATAAGALNLFGSLQTAGNGAVYLAAQGASVVMDAAALVQSGAAGAGTGQISLSASAGIALAQLKTAGSVNLTASAGDIIDSTNSNGGLNNVSANTLNASAAQYIGRFSAGAPFSVFAAPTAALQTDVRVLNASTTGAGSNQIAINNSNPSALAATLSLNGNASSSAWLSNTGALDVSATSMTLGDSYGFISSGGALTLPNTAINVGSGSLNLQGASDIVNLGSANLITAQNLLLKSGASEALATDVQNADISITGAGLGFSLAQGGAAAADGAHSIRFVDLDSSGNAILTNSGNVSISQSNSNSSINLDGNINLASAGAGANLTLLVAQTGAASGDNPGGGTAAAGGGVSNSGGISLTANALVSLGSALVNDGTLRVQGRFENLGTLNVSTGTTAVFAAPAADISFAGSQTAAGNVTLSPGADQDVVFQAGSVLTVASSGVGTGSLLIQNADQMVLDTGASIAVDGSVLLQNIYAVQLQTGASINVGVNRSVSGGDSFDASSGINSFTMASGSSISAPGSLIIKADAGVSRGAGSGAVASSGSVRLNDLTVDQNGDGFASGIFAGVVKANSAIARFAVEGSSITLDGAISAGAPGSNIIPYFGAGSGGVLSGGVNQSLNNFQSVVLQSTSGPLGSSANPLNLGVSRLAANTSTGDIYLREVGAGGLSLESLSSYDASGALQSLTGVSISGGTGSGPKNMLLMANSPLTVNTAVSNNTGGDITLAAQGASANDNLTLNANVTATGGNGGINLYAGNNLLLGAGVSVSAAGTGAISARAGYDYAGGTPQDGLAGASISMASSAVMQSQDGAISLSAPGNIALALIDANSNSDGLSGAVQIDASSNSLGASALLGSGAISDALPGETPNIIGSSVSLQAVNGVGSSDNINLSTSLLSGSNSGTGGFNVQTSAAAALGNISAPGQTISLLAGGDLTDGGGQLVADTVDIQGGINLGVIGGAAINLQTANLRLNSLDAHLANTVAGDLTLGTSVIVGDLVLSNAAGAIGNAASANIAVSGTASLSTSGSGEINLGNQTADLVTLGGLSFTGAAGVTIAADSALSLIGSNSAASLSLASSGAISSAASSNVSVVGATALTAGAGGNISLTDVGNHFAGPVTLSGANVSLSADAAGLSLADTSVSGALLISTTGALSNSATAQITVGGNASLTAASISLGSQPGSSFNAASLTFNSAGDVTISEASSMLVAGSNSAANLSLQTTGNLNSLETGGGTQISVTGTLVNLLAAGVIGGVPREALESGETAVSAGGLAFNPFGVLNAPNASLTVQADSVGSNNLSVDLLGAGNPGDISLRLPVAVVVPVPPVLPVVVLPLALELSQLSYSNALTAVQAGLSLNGNGLAMPAAVLPAAEVLAGQLFSEQAVRPAITGGAAPLGQLAPLVFLPGVGLNLNADIEAAFQRQDLSAATTRPSAP